MIQENSGTLLDEVDVNAVELRAELTERVQPALLCVPVELLGPIRKHLSQILEVRPLLPGRAWRLIRPARVADTGSEVKQYLFLDPDRERGDVQG